MTATDDRTVTERLEGHRVLLVGGAGFIGHHLALALRRRGVEVMVADNLAVNNLVGCFMAPGRAPAWAALYRTFLVDRFALMAAAGVHLRNADARRSDDLLAVFRDFAPTDVVHLAAIASAVEARAQPGLCFDVQLLTLRNVLEICRLYGQSNEHLVLMSSSTVYGDFDAPVVDEATRPKPRGIYANTKYMAERLVRTYRFQHGVRSTIVRPSALYGERCISRRVSQVFAEKALDGEGLPLEGGGAGRLDFTYIDDLVDGITRVLAFNDSMSSYSTYNLTYGQARTIRELANVVREVVPGTYFEERPAARDKPVRGTLSIERARTALGFAPRWALEDGYRRYCEWYRAQWEALAPSRAGARPGGAPARAVTGRMAG